MDFLEQLRAQKREGAQEFRQKQQEERERELQEAARLRAEEEQRRLAESEKDRRKAEEVWACLPDLVRATAAKGLGAAVLKEGSVDERPDDERQSHEITVNRRKYYLNGWQIPFYQKCQAEGVSLTVVTEQVDVGIGRLVRRRFHFLAVDVERL